MTATNQQMLHLSFLLSFFVNDVCGGSGGGPAVATSGDGRSGSVLACVVAFFFVDYFYFILILVFICYWSVLVLVNVIFLFICQTIIECMTKYMQKKGMKIEEVNH